MSQIRRSRLWVDGRLQRALLAHTTLYWFYCLLSVAVIATAWIVLIKPPSDSNDLIQELVLNFGPALIGSCLLLPLVLLDCLRLSNRLAGPMVRISRAMEELADGKQPDKIYLRDTDFWKDFVDNLNRVIDRLPEAARPGEEFRELTPPPPAETTPYPPVTPAPVMTANIYSDMV